MSEEVESWRKVAGMLSTTGMEGLAGSGSGPEWEKTRFRSMEAVAGGARPERREEDRPPGDPVAMALVLVLVRRGEGPGEDRLERGRGLVLGFLSREERRGGGGGRGMMGV